jgi:hypothetical protein
MPLHGADYRTIVDSHRQRALERALWRRPELGEAVGKSS